MEQIPTKKFFEVFDNLSVNSRIKGIFNDAIIERMLISRKEKLIHIYLIMNDMIYSSVIDELRENVELYVSNNFKVRIHVRYELEVKNPDKIMKLFWDNILYEIKKDSPICAGILMDSKWQLGKDNELIISIPDKHVAFLESKKIRQLIQQMLAEELSIDIKVKFVEHEITESEKEEFKQKQIKKERKLVKETVVVAPPSEPTTTEKGKGKSSIDNMPASVIMGKGITGTINPIKDINEESGQVIIIGDVLTVDSREIKGGRYILSFDMTDYTNSITVKSFVKKDLFEERVSSNIKKGSTVKVMGDVQYDKYSQELVVMTRNVEKSNVKFNVREDHAEVKRIELHMHTQMSEMDAVANVKDLVNKAAEWGHEAVAITDHGVCQAFPDAAIAAKKSGIKVIYGVEAYIVDDLRKVVTKDKGQSWNDTYVVFDLETTGFNKKDDKIIEIGAVKIKNGEIIDNFSEFVNPLVPIPTKITELTSITDNDVKDKETIDVILPKFLEFASDSVMVAHNASFDVGFITNKALDIGINIENTVLDTLELSRALFTQIKRHKLNNIAKYLGIDLKNHHRAVDDAQATALIFLKCIEELKEQGIEKIGDINDFAEARVDKKKLNSYHAIILVKNYEGLRNLYELVSISHIEYYYRRPRIPKSIYNKYKNGLIIGTACEAGEFYKAILNNDPKERIDELADFYDYFEIQPIGNNNFMIDKGLVESEEDLRDINRKIVKYGEYYDKPVVATCDVHFMNPSDDIFRKILMAAKKFKDADDQPPLYFRTTDEMLEEFKYLGEYKAKEVVIDNTHKINEMIDTIKPIPDETFPPEIEGSDEELTNITMTKAISMYGDPLPKPVQARLDRELGSIIKNGFAVLYIIAQKLVWKSLEDGYLVGSRGSVGSSFVATMSGITEVNPLPPHYYCRECQYSDFDSEEVIKFAGKSGYDMADKICPNCGAKLIKDGHDIPFETFLGFDGDKEPDIDLNFSGEYQPNAHAYTEVLFGKEQVFRAGTIGTLAEKTAYGFVKKYLDEREIIASNAEINRLILGCTGVKRTTGQHPGGQMVVPTGHKIYQFCPVQRPANDVTSSITTTHFDYHSISGRLLKLDILGHDDPTVIRMLEDLTKLTATDIPLDDKETMSLFTSTDALGVTSEEINSEVGTFGLPELGTKFVRQMLVDTQPTTFSELIRISGLSHGTDVWLTNAQELIRAGTTTLADCISTRDDIMVYLILQGVEKMHSFTIMEKVRKGKGLEPDDEKAMVEAGVPNWYIESCKKIKYMFPKAHAAAYIMMAFRIAYYKVHYAECFYATFFTVRAGDFDYEMMCNGQPKVLSMIKELSAKGNAVSVKEKGTLTILEIVNEMYCRKIDFIPIDLYKSEAVKFQVVDGKILPPLNSIQGLGNTAAYNIVEARKDGEFVTIEQLRERTKISRTVIEVMKETGIIKDMPETNQMSLF